MSEQTAEATATETGATENTEQQPKPSETVDFWKQKAREQEKRAKENAAAATELSTLRESQKSEADKATDRLHQAETRAVEAEARATRREVALEHNLTREDAALLDDLSDEDAMRRLATRLAAVREDSKKNGPHVPREGNNNAAKDDPARTAVRGLFGGD